jgi:hypothetical protein
MKHQGEMLEANLGSLLDIRAAFHYDRRCSFTSVPLVSMLRPRPVPTPEKWGEVDLPEPANYGYGSAKRVGDELVKIMPWLH